MTLKIDLQVLMSGLLAALLIAFVTGGVGAYVRLGVLTSSVDTLKTEIGLLRQAAHSHGGDTRVYLPDAEPE